MTSKAEQRRECRVKLATTVVVWRRGQKQKYATRGTEGRSRSNRKSSVFHIRNHERDKGGIDMPVDTPANKGETW